MGTAKRERQKANRAKKIAEAEVEEQREKREVTGRRWGIIAAVVAGIVGLIVLFSVLGGEDAVLPTPDRGETDAAPTVEPVLSEVPDDFEPFAGEQALASVVAPARNNAYSEPPPTIIDTSKDYTAIIRTDVGLLRVDLFDDEAPLTVNNFVGLARDGFYDGTTFHRVIEDFMAQAGDPTGTGTGGPGYQFQDEFESGLTFDSPGVLAMANSGADTNGSQFFITFVPTPHLDGAHTIFGQLQAEDEATLDQIVRRTPGESAQPTVVQWISIVES